LIFGEKILKIRALTRPGGADCLELTSRRGGICCSSP
jgi:hypothetical protein